MEEKIHGILLSAIPYLGNARILKVFTAGCGLVSLIAKGKWPGCTTPFCEAEWVFRRGKEEIHRLKDVTLLESFSELKSDFSVLSAAGTIAGELLRSQFPSKKGDGLYSLVFSYFKKLPSFQRPEILVASFRLKLLLWEGLLASNETGGMDEGEREVLFFLTFARQFSVLRDVEVSDAFLKKVELFFQEKMR